MIGVLGIIAGIVFLGLELQQNNDLMRAQQRFNQLSIATGTTTMVAENPELAAALAAFDPFYVEMFEKWGGDAYTLTPTQIYQVTMYGSRVIANQQWSFRELPREELPVEVWRSMAQAAFWRFVWDQSRPGLDPDFVGFVEENIIDD